ncbi:MAG: (2Fe-2S) ferredoxin domain-containing protein [Magnetococcales bacterium]|nr:(2Fe-2S) ferredoxin domain-containing protein [Magnetococcales bacterium]
MKPQFIVCVKQRDGSVPSCAERGSVALADQLMQIIKEKNLNIGLVKIQCLGQCANGPNMRLAPGGEFFHRVEQKDLDRIVGKMIEFSQANPSLG